MCSSDLLAAEAARDARVGALAAREDVRRRIEATLAALPEDDKRRTFLEAEAARIERILAEPAKDPAARATFTWLRLPAKNVKLLLPMIRTPEVRFGAWFKRTFSLKPALERFLRPARLQLGDRQVVPGVRAGGGLGQGARQHLHRRAHRHLPPLLLLPLRSPPPLEPTPSLTSSTTLPGPVLTSTNKAPRVCTLTKRSLDCKMRRHLRL